MLHVTRVRYIKDYHLWVTFNDGLEGEVDLQKHLYGSVFEPLKDKTFFSSVAVDHETNTISWSNGADFAPEFLKELLTKKESHQSLKQN